MHVDVETGLCSHVSLVPWLDVFTKQSAALLKKNLNEHEKNDASELR